MVNRRSISILLAVMASGVVPADIAHVDPIDFLAITHGLYAFRFQTGRFPTEAEGLMALVEKPATYPADRRWQQVMKKLPVDPWGNPVHYIVSPEMDRGYGLYSTGKDGVSRSKGNDPDDWNSWSEDGRGQKTFMTRLKDVPPFLYLVLVAVVFVVWAWIRSGSVEVIKPED